MLEATPLDEKVNNHTAKVLGLGNTVLPQINGNDSILKKKQVYHAEKNENQ